MALKLLVGCDPEVFMRDQNNKLVSAHGRIPGTKDNPFPVTDGAVQVDGNALEFNITPASNVVKFVGNVKSVMKQMQAMVPGFNIAIEPVAVWDQGYWEALPNECKELGCQPDFNAYTDGQPNPRPEISADIAPFSAAGGHLHFGWTQDVDPFDHNHMLDCIAVVKQLDYYLGMYSLMWDDDGRRRALYGQPGSFRPKPYGVEYRTLSNAWLRDDRLITWVYNAATKGLRDLFEGRRADKYEPELARRVISANDRGWWHHVSLNVPTNNLEPPPSDLIRPPKTVRPKKMKLTGGGAGDLIGNLIIDLARPAEEARWHHEGEVQEG